MVESFQERGYAVWPDFFDGNEINVLKAAVDEHVAAQPKHAYQNEALGALTWHPRVCELLDEVLGERYVFHHIHAARHDAGTDGVSWHQDYEQIPQTNRSHRMVHVFMYLNGLDGSIGDLLLMPGSEKSVLDRTAFYYLGSPDLPGSLTFDNLPPGSIVIAHSAMLHARRAKPGGENNPRYFIDSSYCQSGVIWPSYPDKFRGELLTDLRGRHLAAGGIRPWLYDETQFFDSERALKLMASVEGSVAVELPQWRPG